MEKSSNGLEYFEHLSPREKMSAWAGNHQQRSDGLFRVTGSEDFKNLDVAHYPNKFAGRNKLLKPFAHQKLKKGLYELGDFMFPEGGFNEMVDAFKANKDMLGDIQNLVANQKTVVVATDHPWLMNGAVAEAALYCAIDDWRIAEHSGYIINAMTGWLEVSLGKNKEGQDKSISVIGTVSELSDVFCCIPKSQSVKDLGLVDFAYDYNFKMLKPLVRKAREGMILHANPSGSLDLLDEDENGNLSSIVMQTVDPTTADLLSRYTSAALTIVMWKEGEKFSFDIADNLIEISDESDVHKMMKAMENPYHDLVSQARPSKSSKLTVRYNQPLAA